MLNYWENREIIAREAVLERNIKDTEKLLKKKYKTTSKHLSKKILEYYEDLKLSVNPLDSHRFAYNKYYTLSKEIDKELKALGESELTIMDKKLTDTYKDNVKALKSIGYPLSDTVNTKAIKKVIDEYWVGDGYNWSSRIWRNKSKMKAILEQGIFEVITTGKNPSAVTKMVNDKCGVGFNTASRLVHTELCHIQIQSTIDSYKECGIERYIFLTANDERVCPDCSALDGKEFVMSEAQAGVNLPPIHPRCHCDILAVIN